MKKRLKKYTEETEKLVSELSGKDMPEERLRRIREEMLVQISFFQHERLVHLLVTILFAILTVLSFFGSILTMETWIFVLTGLFLVLLIPYIFHYYFLENGVQHLYELYDRLNCENALHADDSVII